MTTDQRWQETWEIGETGIPRTVTQPQDPAYILLLDEHRSVPDASIYRMDCYICNDPEFAQMGLPLCKACPECKIGHIAADDDVCDVCGVSAYETYLKEEEDRHEACAKDGGHQMAQTDKTSWGTYFKCYCGFSRLFDGPEFRSEPVARPTSIDDVLATMYARSH